LRCVWRSESNVCIPKDTTTFTCNILSKTLCNKYGDMDTYIDNFNVIDAPCFFNGPDDSIEMLCISKSTINSKNCSSIKTNSVIVYQENTLESCNNAKELFVFSFTCRWKLNHIDDVGLCETVYYLTTNGFLFLFFYFS
jgi:hypothetical protein